MIKKCDLVRLSDKFPLFLLCIFLIIMAVSNIGFYSPYNVYNVLYSTSIIVPAVIGMQLLLITGYFDLSTGSVAAFSSIMTVIVLKNTGSIFVAFAVGLVVGILVGYFNSLLVSRLNINCLIATIATMGMWRGVSLALSGGLVISGLPYTFSYIARARLMTLEMPIIVSFFLILVVTFLSKLSIPFRRFYHIGSNKISANICGLNINAVLNAAFMFSSIGAAITGIIGASRTMTASPNTGETLALDTIAACVIGGSSLRGGKGSIIGAVVGLIIIQITENVVIISGVSLYWRYFVIGIILLIAVSIDNLLLKRNGVIFDS